MKEYNEIKKKLLNVNKSDELSSIKEETFIELLSMEQTKILKQRHFRMKEKQEWLNQKDRLKNKISLRKNGTKTSRRNGKLNFKINWKGMFSPKQGPGPKKPKKELKEIILRNKGTFKIDKIKRYQTEGNNIAENIFQNIKNRLKGRNNFQFQKNVNRLLKIYYFASLSVLFCCSFGLEIYSDD